MADCWRQRAWQVGCVGWFLMLLASACGGSDDPVRIEFVDLAKGEFYGLVWGGTQVERFHVVARPGTPDRPVSEAVLVSPEHDKPCSLGVVSTYQLLQPRTGGKYVVGSPSPLRVALFGELDEAERGTLGFADVDCDRIDLTIPDSSRDDIQRLYTPDLSSLKIAARASDGSLVFADPYEERITKIADDVRSLWASGSTVWLNEGGELVKRNLEGRLLSRTGKQVSSLKLIGREGDYAYTNERGLFLMRDGKEKQLATGSVCSVDTIDGFLSQAIAYLSPCETRKLNVALPDGKTATFQEGVDIYSSQLGRLFFLTHGETTSKIWMARASEPMRATVVAELPRFGLQTLWNTPEGRIVLFARQLDDTFSLLLIDPNLEAQTPVVLGEKIIWAMSAGNTGLATLEGDGTLVLRDRETTRPLWRTRGVTAANFRFVFGGEALALAYLADVDQDTKLGRLELHMVSGEHFTITDEVREFREVWWPERGIVFAQGGKDAALRFARVDIPCEMLSSSPWACDF